MAFLNMPPRCKRASRRPGWLVCVAMVLWVSAAWAAIGPDREYRIKAVFLFNFTQFVEWPDSAFQGNQAPLVVGILGSDPFDAYLDEVVSGEKVGERRIEIRRFSRAEDVKDCHVLFLSASESPRFKAALEVLDNRPVLTVGESDAFFSQGGMVRFATEKGKIRLKINLETAQKAHLSVSSKLLRLADVAAPRKD